MLVPGNNMMLRGYGAVPPVSCVYPLNDDGTIASMFGTGFAPATAPGYQNVTYVLTGGAPAPSYVAMTTPANPFAPPALTTFTGRKGFGFTVPQMPASITDELYLALICFSASPGNMFRFRIRGDGQVQCESGTTGSVNVDATITGVTISTAKFGMVADGDTGVVHFYINGILVGNSGVLLDEATGFIFNQILDSAVVSIGSTVEYNLVSDAATLGTYGFTPGTTTICGEVISSTTIGYPLADDGTLAGMFSVNSIPATPTIYNEFSYTYLSPSSPIQGAVLPSVAAFGSTARIPLAGAIRGCEMRFDTLPVGDFQNISLGAVYFNGMSIVGQSNVGVQRILGVDEYVSSGGSQPRALNSDFRVGIVVDGNTGDAYFLNSENTSLADTGAATGATHVVFLILLTDDGTTPASQTASGSLIPNAGDMSLFYAPSTVDYQDLPCPVNPNWGGPAPVVLSAYTDSLYGTEIFIQYDQPITGTPSLGYTFSVNSNPITFSSVSQSAPDTFYFTGLSTFIQYGDTVTVDYAVPPGDTVSDPGGVPVVAYTGQVVTNNVPANPTCNYPFTIGNTEIVMSNFNMTGSYVLESGSKFYLKQPYGFPTSPYQFNVTAGISVLELGFDSFNRPAGGLSSVNARFQFKDITGTSIGRVELQAQNTGYTLLLSMDGYGSSSISLGQALPQRVGIRFDNNTATVDVFTENTLRLTSTYNNGLGDAVMELGYQTFSIGGTDVGQTYSYTVYTLASDFLQTCYDPDYLVALDNCLNSVQSGAQYAFNDTLGITATSLGFTPAFANGTPFPPQQNVTYTTTGSVTGGFAVAIPNFAFSPLYPTLGPIRFYAVGMLINGLPTVGTGEGAMVGLTASQYTIASTSRSWFLGAGRNDTTDLYIAEYGNVPIYSNGAFSIDDTQPYATLVGKKLGILIDTYTGDVAYYVDGQRTLLSGQACFTGSTNWYFALAFADQATGDFSPTPIGQNYDVTLLSRAEDLEGMGFPPTTRDILGNLILSVPATFNPTDNAAINALTNDNTTVENTTPGYSGVRTTLSRSSGKWYWENKIDTGTRVIAGVGTSAVNLNSTPYLDLGFFGYESDTGDIYAATVLVANVATSTTGDTIGFALDMDAGTLDIMLGGVSAYQITGLTGTLYPLTSVFQAKVTGNWGRDMVSYPMLYEPLYGYQKGLYDR